VDNQMAAEIKKQCGRCQSGGLEENGSARCFHPYHPGLMGGWGTEWALCCSHFRDSGKVGYIKRTISIERREA